MKKVTIKDIIFLQAIVIIYTFNGVLAKFSTGQEFLSFGFFLFYGAEVAVLGIYAILWQQVIKKFELSTAYANRAMAILWAGVWSIVIFHEQMTLKMVIGIVLVIAGTIVVNLDIKKSDEAESKTVECAVDIIRETSEDGGAK